jgi:enoyl-[acyl-carrier protein] reductase II
MPNVDMPAVALAAVPGRRRATLDLARDIERRGFSGIYCASFGDGLGLCEALALVTDRIPFGTAISIIYMRHPAEYAQTTALVHELSAGRFRFGIGVSHVPVHVVPSLSTALKASAAGVDGLVVEGGEGGGFKNPLDVATMVLLPLVCSKVSVPVIAAGGICDGSSMAAAFALGAEGVQMGSRMVSAAESPVHGNWKQAILDAAETDTVFLNRFSRPGLRALRTARTTALERQEHVGMDVFARAKDLYFGGDMEAAIALAGQVVGRIDAIKPVAQIIAETIAGFRATVARLAAIEGAT